MVNTYLSQTLNGYDGVCNFEPAYAGNDNPLGCFTNPDVFSGDVNLLSTNDPFVPIFDPNTTSLTLTNGSLSIAYNIVFTWKFQTDGGVQTAEIAVDYGGIEINGVNEGLTYAIPNDSGGFQDARVTLPPGAKLTFSLYTENDGNSNSVFAIKGFDAVEIPAPLPVAGGGAAFAFSRRLRRRQRQAALLERRHRVRTGRPLDVAALRRREFQLRAIQGYGALIGGLQMAPPPVPEHMIAAEEQEADPVAPSALCNGPVSLSNSP